jgi:hypothetical protein
VAAGVAGGGSAGSGGLLAQSLVGAGLALLMVAGWLTWSGRGLRGTREA